MSWRLVGAGKGGWGGQEYGDLQEGVKDHDVAWAGTEGSQGGFHVY
jgi:hypothetical protein